MRPLGRKQTALDAKNEDNATLQTLFAEVQAQWQDINGRRLGDVDWAPEISVRVDDRHYTRDIATFGRYSGFRQSSGLDVETSSADEARELRG